MGQSPRASPRASADVSRYYEAPVRQASGASDTSRPSLEAPTRQGTGEYPTTPLSFDMPRTPVTVASEDYFTDDSQGAPSYVHAKYSLPRGSKRESIAPGDFILKQFNWESSFGDRRNYPPSGYPQIQTSTPSSPQRLGDQLASQYVPSSISHTSPRPPSPTQRSRSFDVSGTGSPKPPRRAFHKPTASTPSTYTATTDSSATSTSTIRATLNTTRKSKGSSADLSPEDHLTKGIELHERGNLRESTYHLRIAAKAGLPTAQLLYALACRHGWGMQQSQSEAIVWLQKAVDSAQLEVADDEDIVARGNGGGGSASNDAEHAQRRKTHKAQFALGVYELG
ncbi:hypothetical protein LTS18_014428, partial [Coniosporium uncinatum]